MDSHESTVHSTKVRGRSGEIQRTSLSLILHVLNSSRLKSLQSSYYKPFAFVCVVFIIRLINDGYFVPETMTLSQNLLMTLVQWTAIV